MGRLASTTDATAQAARGTPLLLVAAPERVIRRMLEGLLLDQGYQVVTAHSGERAVALYEQHQPDLVLLDLGAADSSDFACCAALRALAGHGPLPLLTMADRGGAETVERALRAGATDFQVKPVDATLLRARIRQALQHRATALALARAEARLAQVARPTPVDVVQGPGPLSKSPG